MSRTHFVTEFRAREIAAEYQSSGTTGLGFAVFAGSGKITDQLLDNLYHAIGHADSGEVADLFALSDYLMSETITVYATGSNVPGYLPDDMGSIHIAYSDAYDALQGEVEFHSGDMSELVVRDFWESSEYVAGKTPDVEYVCAGLNRAFFLHGTVMSVARYVDECGH